MTFTASLNRSSKPQSVPETRPKRDWLLWMAVPILGYVFLVGGAPMYLQASGAQKVNETVNNLNALQGQIAQLFSNKPSYPNVPFTADMIRAGIVPANMVTSPTTMQNAWGGATTFQPVANGQTYSIAMANIPQDACIALLTKLAGGQSQTTLQGFHVVPNGPPGLPQQARIVPPVNVSGAISACQGQQINGITFFYR